MLQIIHYETKKMSQKAMEISPFLIVFANIPKLLSVFFGADNTEISFTLTS